MKSPAAVLLFIFALWAGPLFAQQTEEDVAPPTQGEALTAWGRVYEVFSHPRCSNCHVPEDNRPRWSGPSYGDGSPEQGWQYHGMNIHAGDSRDGADYLPCRTCHMAENSPVPHGPPGAEVWKLAPVEMVWWQKSSAFICKQIKDPARNGGRSLAAVAEHVEKDHLVHWGWAPGPGREPAPYSAEQTAADIRAWKAAGAPCPGSGGGDMIQFLRQLEAE